MTTLRNFILTALLALGSVWAAQIGNVYQAVIKNGEKAEKSCMASLKDKALLSKVLESKKVNRKDYEKWASSKKGKKALSDITRACIEGSSKKWNMASEVTDAGLVLSARAEKQSKNKPGSRLAVTCSNSHLHIEFKTPYLLENNLSTGKIGVKLSFDEQKENRLLRVEKSGKSLASPSEIVARSLIEKMKKAKRLRLEAEGMQKNVVADFDLAQGGRVLGLLEDVCK